MFRYVFSRRILPIWDLSDKRILIKVSMNER